MQHAAGVIYWGEFQHALFETVCSLINDISTNSAPQNICDVFSCSSDVHTYNTRFSDACNLYVNKLRLRINLIRFPFSELSCGIA